MAINHPPSATPQQQEEPVIIVRGSEEHKDYLKHQFGRIKETVNSFETRIAVAGRVLLLIYVVYITVKAATASALPHDMAPWLTATLLILDILMQALQVLGLEGSVPGLTHLAGELEEKGKIKEARTVRLASNTAQWLLAFTAIDIVLESNHTWGGMDISGFAVGYTNCLFIVRVIVIGLYLVAMARLEHKGPRIISAHEAARMEQEQVRMDNAAIQASIGEALTNWTKLQDQALADKSTLLAQQLHGQLVQLFGGQLAALTSEQERVVLALQQVQSVSPAVPVIDNQAIIAGVLAQFETRFTVAMKRLEGEVKQQVLVSLASETGQVKQVSETLAGPRTTVTL